jgi:hypothetical protein
MVHSYEQVGAGTWGALPPAAPVAVGVGEQIGSEVQGRPDRGV